MNGTRRHFTASFGRFGRFVLGLTYQRASSGCGERSHGGDPSREEPATTDGLAFAEIHFGGSFRPCAACHGPLMKSSSGAPLGEGQAARLILNVSSQPFAQGMRQNDTLTSGIAARLHRSYALFSRDATASLQFYADRHR